MLTVPILAKSGKDVSFSKVTWTDMAPRLGLELHENEEHLSSFNMERAHLPKGVFHNVVRDVNKLSLQFGRVDDTPNEEARSRVIQGVRRYHLLNRFRPCLGIDLFLLVT